MNDKDSARKNLTPHYIISLAFIVLFGFIPPFGQITQLGMIVLGIMVGVLYSWAKGLSPWVAAFAMIFYGLRANQSFTAVTLPAAFGNSTLWVCLFCFAFLYGARNSGLVEYLSKKLLRLKLANKGPYGLMIVTFIATFITSAITQAGNAVILIILAMLKDWTKDLKLKQYSSWTFMTGAGVSVAVVTASTMMPYNFGVQIAYSTLNSFGLATPNYLWVAIFSLACFVIVEALIVLVTKYILRPKVDAEAFRSMKVMDDTQDIKFTRPMLLVLLDTILMAAMIAIPMALPHDWGITIFMNKIGVVGAFLIAAIILCFIKDVNGKPLFDFASDMRATTDWNLIWNLAIIFYLGGMFNSETTGILSTLATLFKGGSNPIIIAFVICFGCCMMTNLVNNLVALMMFAPICLSFIPDNIVYQGVVVVSCVMLSNFAFALPSASWNAMMMHAEKETFKFSHLFFGGFAISIVSTFVVYALAVAFRNTFYIGIF